MRIIYLGIFLVILALITMFFQNKFRSGWCVKDNRDDYIWHVNTYGAGVYQLMGWQNDMWGNPIEMKKEVLERRDVDGIQIYHRVKCPD